MKDRFTVYKLNDFTLDKAVIDGYMCLIAYYRISERKKLKFLQNIESGTLYYDRVILDSIFKKQLHNKLFKYLIAYRYETRAEWEKKNPHIGTYINQNVENSRGNISLQAPTGNTVNYINNYIEQWNEEIYENNGMSADEKVLLYEILMLLKQDKKIDKSKAKKCINIISGMNTMFTFGRVLIEILIQFL